MYIPKNTAATITLDVWTKANRTVPATGGAGSIAWTWWRPGMGSTKTAFTPTAVGELGFGRYWLTIPASVPIANGELLIVGETATAYGDRSLHVGPLDDIAADAEANHDAATLQHADELTELATLSAGLAGVQSSLTNALPAAPGLTTRPGYLEIIPGDDYDNTGQNRHRWTFQSTYNWAGGTTVLEVDNLDGTPVTLTQTGYLTTADSLNWVAEVQTLAAATATLTPNFTPEALETFLDQTANLTRLDLWRFTPTYTYRAYATTAAGKRRTLAAGLLVVPRYS